MISQYDKYFQVDRNNIPLRYQDISFKLRHFLRDNYNLTLPYDDIWNIIKDPEFRESFDIKIPNEMIDIENCKGDDLFPQPALLKKHPEFKKYMYKKYIEFRNAFLPDFENYIEYLDDYKVKHKIYGIIDEYPFIIGFTLASGVYHSETNKKRTMEVFDNEFSLVRIFTAKSLNMVKNNPLKWWDDSDPEIKKSTMALIIEFINQEEFILKNQKIAS